MLNTDVNNPLYRPLVGYWRFNWMLNRAVTRTGGFSLIQLDFATKCLSVFILLFAQWSKQRVRLLNRRSPFLLPFHQAAKLSCPQSLKIVQYLSYAVVKTAQLAKRIAFVLLLYSQDSPINKVTTNIVATDQRTNKVLCKHVRCIIIRKAE